jgi:hypothetical protein
MASPIHNDGRFPNNFEETIALASDVTFYIGQSGTENATTKYISKINSTGGQCYATGFVLRPSATVNIVGWNGITFRNPITVTTAGFSITKNIEEIRSIVIRTLTADTIVRLFLT